MLALSKTLVGVLKTDTYTMLIFLLVCTDMFTVANMYVWVCAYMLFVCVCVCVCVCVRERERERESELYFTPSQWV